MLALYRTEHQTRAVLHAYHLVPTLLASPSATHALLRLHPPPFPLLCSFADLPHLPPHCHHHPTPRIAPVNTPSPPLSHTHTNAICVNTPPMAPTLCRYFTGLDGQGNPTWSLDGSQAQPSVQFGNMVGENAVSYSPYLKRWVDTLLALPPCPHVPIGVAVSSRPLCNSPGFHPLPSTIRPPPSPAHHSAT
jgi:hypothetical protein